MQFEIFHKPDIDLSETMFLSRNAYNIFSKQLHIKKWLPSSITFFALCKLQLKSFSCVLKTKSSKFGEIIRKSTKIQYSRVHAGIEIKLGRVWAFKIW